VVYLILHLKKINNKLITYININKTNDLTTGNKILLLYKIINLVIKLKKCMNENIFSKKFEFKHIFINDLEETSAIYSFWFKSLTFPLYVGKTENLKRRMREYFRGGHNKELNDYLNNLKRRKHVHIRYFYCNKEQLTNEEDKCILYFNPKLNKEKIRK